MCNQEKYNQIKNLCSDFYSEMDKLIAQVFFDFESINNEYLSDLRNYLFGESKQIRSCLIFLLAKNLGYSSADKDIVKLATVVEIIHNATLIHDDIIDDSPIRRGQDALHEKYSNKLGVISGDFLLSLAMKLLLDLPPVVMQNFSRCLMQLCSGEIEQYFSLQKTPSFVIYFKKSEQKTSSLFIAGVISLFNLKKIECVSFIEAFANHFGRAFQIKDDLKNIISKDDNKPILNDIEQGLYTLPVIYAYGENKDLTNIPPEEILEKTMAQAVIEKTINVLNEEVQSAINNISVLSDNEYKKAIISLCNLLKIG